MLIASIVQIITYVGLTIIIGKAMMLIFAKIFLMLPKEIQTKILKDAVEMRQRVDEAWRKRKL